MRVATFNANNLFSRWSFEAELPRTATAVPTAEVTGPAAAGLEAAAATEAQPVPQPKVVDVTLPDGTALTGVLRTYLGNLVKGKDAKARAWIAKRIKALDADVLCLQEVEDQGALDAFNRDDLAPLAASYPYRVAVEGNDPRRIDVAICSRVPIVRISSWRYWPRPTGEPVFGRDLLQAEIDAPDGRSLHVFVNHLKSNYIPKEFTLSADELNQEREANRYIQILADLAVSQSAGRPVADWVAEESPDGHARYRAVLGDA